MDFEAVRLLAPVPGPRVRATESLTTTDAGVRMHTRYRINFIRGLLWLKMSHLKLTVYAHVPVYIMQASHLDRTKVALVLAIINDTLSQRFSLINP